ncbi:MAG: hypothetical protein Q8L48_36025 [Archangium sp.]|nr:hypothetical protein [Archangium sp.]
MRTLMSVLMVVAALPAWAETDLASFYEVTTDGTSTKLKAGETGKVIIAIKSKNGAHVSDEAPLKIELSSKQSKLGKEKLTLADSLNAKKEDPRFEVPFTPTAHGSSTVEAKVTFFICTEKLCSRQVKNLSFPVEVM